MFDRLGQFIINAADVLGGYPLFFLLIGGGLYLIISSGFVSIRRFPTAIAELRRKSDGNGKNGQISSVQALASVVAATIGLGNIAGVAIALVIGGPGAIFWMWVSAIVGMATKYHEGALAIMYKGKDDRGKPQGGPMHIITKGLGPKWTPLARFFAIAGMFGTLCIMSANQLTLGGIKRIARVATIMVPFMVGLYFLMVMFIIITNIEGVPAVFGRIFSEAFNLDAGIGALAGIALIGARRAALVNDAGIGTASLMHGASNNTEPVREGLIAMLGPSIDSGLVCTLTAVAILLCGNIDVDGVQGLTVAMQAFSNGIPKGDIMLMCVVICFALSSMFSYSFYGTTCANYIFGTRYGRYYAWFFLASLIVFAVIPIETAVGACDLFYALMAIPTMTAVLLLSPRVRKVTNEYFDKLKKNKR